MGLNIKKLGPNRYKLDVRRRRPEGGEDRTRETFVGTLAEAQKRFITLRDEVQERQSLLCRFETVADLLRFYEDRRGALSYREKSLINGILRDLGDVPLSHFPARLEAWITHARKYPSPKTKRPLENASINRLVGLIRAAFNKAVNCELLEKNPISRARFPRLKEVARDTVLTPVSLQRLFNVMELNAPHLVPITRYALQIPCRKTELVNMRGEHLDLFNNIIRVRNGATKNDRGCDKPILEGMQQYFRNIPKDCPWLFYREEAGEYFPLGDFSTAWNTCLRLAGISDFHFHDTRHMAATALLNAGVPERVVMQIAGWTSDMMKRYYHRSAASVVDVAKFFSGVRTLGADTPESKGLSEALG